MELTTKNIGRITVVEVTGRMTVDNIYSLTKSIERTVLPFTGKNKNPVGKSRCRVILDMKGVDIMDSSGIGTIAFLAKKCRALGGDLKIAAVSPGVKKVFELVKLDKVYQFCNSVDDAIKGHWP
jgi:anti-anti-sigma factor